MKNSNFVKGNDTDLLNAYADGELGEEQLSKLLARLDDEPELRDKLKDLHRVKDLLQVAYPLKTKQTEKIVDRKRVMGMVASLLLALGLGFLGGNASSRIDSVETSSAPSLISSNNHDVDLKYYSHSEFDHSIDAPAQKVIIYLGSARKEKFDETLDRAEALLTKYKKDGTQVFVVTSAGGLDLLRTDNGDTENRIIKMKGLYKSLNFVACNNQIYQLHRDGQMVNLVDDVQVAPSAVQFVVNHLKKGWKFIAI